MARDLRNIGFALPVPGPVVLVELDEETPNSTRVRSTMTRNEMESI